MASPFHPLVGETNSPYAGTAALFDPTIVTLKNGRRGSRGLAYECQETDTTDALNALYYSDLSRWPTENYPTYSGSAVPLGYTMVDDPETRLVVNFIAVRNGNLPGVSDPVLNGPAWYSTRARRSTRTAWRVNSSGSPGPTPTAQNWLMRAFYKAGARVQRPGGAHAATGDARDG